MTFEDAAYYFSTDKQTRNNGGLMSGKNGDSRIEKAEIEGDMAKQVNRMKVGEISEPFVSKSEAREEYKSKSFLSSTQSKPGRRLANIRNVTEE